MSEYLVDGWNNFCRVFELPERFTGKSRDCSGSSISYKFFMVDWFSPIDGLPQPTVTREVWEEQIGLIPTEVVTEEQLRKEVVPFVQRKAYIKPGRGYLILFSFGAALSFRAE